MPPPARWFDIVKSRTVSALGWLMNFYNPPDQLDSACDRWIIMIYRQSTFVRPNL